MSGNIKHFAPPVKNANSANGYSLAYALSHPRKIPHRLPSGWRWLEIGEYPEAGDVCCDPRIAPVQILLSGPAITDTHHPVRTKRPKPASHPLQDAPGGKEWQHDGPCYEDGMLEGLEYAAKFADKFKVEGFDLSVLAEEIRKLKCQVFPQENMTCGCDESVNHLCPKHAKEKADYAASHPLQDKPPRPENEFPTGFPLHEVPSKAAPRGPAVSVEALRALVKRIRNDELFADEVANELDALLKGK